MSLLQDLLAILSFLIGGYGEWRVSKVHRPLKTGLPSQSLRPLMAEFCLPRLGFRHTTNSINHPFISQAA